MFMVVGVRKSEDNVLADVTVAGEDDWKCFHNVRACEWARVTVCSSSPDEAESLGNCREWRWRWR